MTSIYVESGRQRDAIDCLQQHALAFPEQLDCVITLVEFSESTGLGFDFEDLSKTLLSGDSFDAIAFLDLGRFLANRSFYLQASKFFERVLQQQPNNIKALYSLAECSVHLKQYSRAISMLERLIMMGKLNFEILNMLGACNQAMANTKDALVFYEKARQFSPDEPSSVFNLGKIHQTNGDFEKALICFKTALDMQPELVDAIGSIAFSKKFNAGDLKEIQDYSRLLLNSRMNPSEQATLHFALAKMYDDLERFDTAFNHFRQANKLRAEASDSFDLAATKRHFVTIAKSFSGQTLKRDLGTQGQGAGLCFLVGLPRSGSSLLEQVLSSHSEVKGIGEVHTLLNCVSQLPNILGTEINYPGCIDKLASDKAARISAGILNSYLLAGEQRQLMVDKTLTNFMHVGLIHMLLPKAKIIYCQRDPRDICLSNFFTDFTAGHRYSNSLNDLAHYSAAFATLMGHWSKNLPEQIGNFEYETFIDDSENATRNVLSQVGLEFEEACLNFHQTNRVVNTASSWQVRQPLYTSSKGRIANYQHSLESHWSDLAAWKEYYGYPAGNC